MKNCPICSINIFSRLDDDEVSDLKKIISFSEYAKGAVVFRQEDSPAKLHLLFEGQMKSVKYSEDGKETVLHLIEEGEPFSLVPCYLNIPYTGTCVAIKDSKVGKINRHDFLNVLTKNPEISLKIMASMAQRTKNLLSRIESQTSLSPTERLLEFLNKEMEIQNTHQFTLPVNKADLARLLGMEPETLSRCFSNLIQKNKIKVDGKIISNIR